MEARLLKYFSVLAEELHYGRTAKRLHISQPPLFPDILTALMQSYPKIETILLESDTESQISALRKGSIEIGFVRTPIDVKDIIINPIYKEIFSLIL